jgi:hypothetical protein
MAEDHKENARWEDIFERSTLDMSDMAHAVSGLAHLQVEADATERLFCALSARAKVRQALGLMKNSIPDQYKPYKEKLKALFEKADAALTGILDRHGKKVEQILDAEGFKRSQALWQLFERLRLMAQDGFLLAGTGADENLREEGHLFLVLFQDLALARQELETSLEGRVNAPQFFAEFDRLESAFVQNTTYLACTEDLWPVLAQRQYGRAASWLARPPSSCRVSHPWRDPAQLEAIAQAFRLEALAAAKDCDMARQTIAFGKGFLKQSEIPQIQEHLASCRFCRRLLLDVSRAESSALDESGQDTDVWPQLEQALGIGSFKHKALQKADSLGRVFGNLTTIRVLTSLLLAALLLAGFWFGFGQRVFMREIVQPPLMPPSSALEEPDAIAQPGTVKEFEQGEREIRIKLLGRSARSGPAGGVMGGLAPAQVPQGGFLKSGDSFQVHFAVEKASFVFIFFEDSSGNISPLLRGKVIDREYFVLPGINSWYTLDDVAGTETVWVLASHKPIPDFYERLGRLRERGMGALGELFPEAYWQAFSFEHRPAW